MSLVKRLESRACTTGQFVSRDADSAGQSRDRLHLLLRETEREIERDRQTDRERQTERDRDRQRERQTERERDREADRER